jgi:predicted  nucleic acid-binding Zn-ribbon protein
MIKLQHECSACGTEFTIQYDEMNTESDPAHCPFCGEFLVLDPDDFGDDDEDDE